MIPKRLNIFSAKFDQHVAYPQRLNDDDIFMLTGQTV